MHFLSLGCTDFHLQTFLITPFYIWLRNVSLTVCFFFLLKIQNLQNVYNYLHILSITLYPYLYVYYYTQLSLIKHKDGRFVSDFSAVTRYRKGADKWSKNKENWEYFMDDPFSVNQIKLLTVCNHLAIFNELFQFTCFSSGILSQKK